MARTYLPISPGFEDDLQAAEGRLEGGRPLKKREARAIAERSLLRLIRSARPAIARQATRDLMLMHGLAEAPRRRGPNKPKLVPAEEPDPKVPSIRKRLGL